MALFKDALDREQARQKRLEENKQLEELRDKTEFEKGDLLALTIAGLVTILPITIVGIVIVVFFGKLVLGI